MVIMSITEQSASSSVNVKTEDADEGRFVPVKMEDIVQTPDPEPRGVRPVDQDGEESAGQIKREEIEHPVMPSAPAEPAEPVPAREVLDVQVHKARVIIQRYVKQKLSKGIALSEPEVHQLSSVIRFCTRLPADAKPYIEKYTLTKALRHVLRASTILPDYLPPQIEVLLSAWARDEYNLDTNNVGDVDDEESSAESESEDEDDIDEGLTLGRGSAMRGIQIKRSVAGHTIYVLNKAAQRTSAIIGHNGLRVGAWWPMQICALRDGAHGSRMGGIAGKRNVGAYSIVISDGGYDDKDLGDTVWYTGSGDTKEGDQPMTNSNQALATSFSRGLPVRVIRTSKLDSEFAPSKGMRYDGLYRVAWYGQVEGPHGYKVWKYKMVRLPDQDPIRRDVPTRVELRTLG